MMKEELTNLPFHLMRKLYQDHTAEWQKHLPTLTKPQYAVMCAVYKQPGIEQQDLMEPSVCTKATLAELLIRLEKRGLIVRQQSENDRRRKYVFLTAEGEKILLDAIPVAHKIDNTFIASLDEFEQIQFISTLKKLLQHQS